MARIAESDIEAVKRSADLIALVQSRGIALSKHGAKDWKGLCPFHEDKGNPNFIVSPAKGLWHCMACGKAGNAIQFVQEHDGMSFRHAYELLTQGGAAAYAAKPLTKQATVPVLPCPLEGEADDATLITQVADYYHERLLQSPAALDYLASRGLGDMALIKRYKLGFADRSLGLRLPEANRKQGELIRSRLMQLGLWRASGHEHFNGCVVVPLQNPSLHTVSFYGRRIGTGSVKHLYPPGPHRGLFNPEAFDNEEVILCEAVLDALTFCSAGFTNASCIYGTEGWSPDIEKALRKVQRVRLAYDADEAGERAAERDSKRLQELGIEVWRIKYPWGMDASEYARKVTPPSQSLKLLINAAAWCGMGKKPSACSQESETEREGLEGNVLHAPAPTPSSLAASVSSLEVEKEEAKKEAAVPVPTASILPLASSAPVLEQRGEAWFLSLETREYRLTGLEKTLTSEGLKVALRIQHGERFHLDQIDLQRDGERRRFIERAHEETGLSPELLKRDMGKLLLAVELTQSHLASLRTPATTASTVVQLTPQERAEALAWLQAPKLMDRLRESFRLSGIIGEEKNTLLAYLAGVSRKLERPLAVIIQSASAAGKSTLMDAVLSFFPEEERVKYSAMTGQSLYYLGESNLSHKILAVVEEAGAEKASYALKLLQSEGELTIASTGKDPHSGRMVTQEYHLQGPVMLFLTTTAIDIDEELLNRCIVLSVDESAAQTAMIQAFQREKRTLEGLIASEERKEVLRVLRNAQRLLTPVKVLNPYARGLTFPAGRTRNRRDHEKYLTLIDAIALLHQHQRKKGTHTTGTRVVEYIEVILEDIALANELAPELLGRSLDELPPQTRRLLEVIRELVRAKAAEESIKTAFTFSRREVREKCGWSLTQVRVHLSRLVELEYIAPRCGRPGSSYEYDLLVGMEEERGVAHIGLIEVEELRKIHECDSNLAGEKPHLAVGGGESSARGKNFITSHLETTWRVDGNAHQERETLALVS